jgi:hypothetical protein
MPIRTTLIAPSNPCGALTKMFKQNARPRARQSLYRIARLIQEKSREFAVSEIFGVHPARARFGIVIEHDKASGE